MSRDLVPTAGGTIHTDRLVLRPWSVDDAEEALAVYGDAAVARWLTPAMGRVEDLTAMATLVDGWSHEGLTPPEGRWVIEESDSGRLVGGVAVLPLPPDGEDLEIAWQLAPEAWGRGLASEAGRAVVRHAFESGADELFAVVRPHNTRGAAAARRAGMDWVGETEKYYDLRLQVYRLRKGDLDVPQQRSPSG